GPAQRRVPGQVDLPHAARAQQALEPVTAERPGRAGGPRRLVLRVELGRVDGLRVRQARVGVGGGGGGGGGRGARRVSAGGRAGGSAGWSSAVPGFNGRPLGCSDMVAPWFPGRAPRGGRYMSAERNSPERV